MKILLPILIFVCAIFNLEAAQLSTPGGAGVDMTLTNTTLKGGTISNATYLGGGNILKTNGDISGVTGKLPVAAAPPNFGTTNNVFATVSLVNRPAPTPTEITNIALSLGGGVVSNMDAFYSPIAIDTFRNPGGNQMQGRHGFEFDVEDIAAGVGGEFRIKTSGNLFDRTISSIGLNQMPLSSLYCFIAKFPNVSTSVGLMDSGFSVGGSQSIASPLYGGSGAALTGITGVRGEIQAAQRKPYVTFLMFTNAGPDITFEETNMSSEFYCVTTASNFFNSAYFAPLTNAGILPTILLDSGWQNQHRVSGAIVGDTSRFPNGMRAVADKLKTSFGFGLLVNCMFESHSFKQGSGGSGNTEEDTRLDNGAGTSLGFYPNGGTEYINGGTSFAALSGHTLPNITPDTVQYDIFSFYTNHFTGIYIQDAVNSGQPFYHQQLGEIGDGILFPNFANPKNMGFGVSNQMAYGIFVGDPLANPFPKEALYRANGVSYDQNPSDAQDGVSVVGNPDLLMRAVWSNCGDMARDLQFFYINDTLQGLVGATEDTNKTVLSEMAMLNGNINIYIGGFLTNTWQTNLFHWMTNAGYLSVAADPKQYFPYLIKDYGTNTSTAGTIVGKKLNDADRAIEINFVNLSASSQTLACDLTNALLNAGEIYAQTETWSNQFIAYVSGASTISVTVPSYSQVWYKFKKVGTFSTVNYSDTNNVKQLNVTNLVLSGSATMIVSQNNPATGLGLLLTATNNKTIISSTTDGTAVNVATTANTTGVGYFHNIGLRGAASAVCDSAIGFSGGFGLYSQSGVFGIGACQVTITTNLTVNQNVNNGSVHVGDTLRVGPNPLLFATNVALQVDGGISTRLSNTLAPTSITFPATTVNWTNTFAFNIEMYVDNPTVTGTAFNKNGTTIFTSLAGDITLQLQPGEYFSETYTVGTPTGKWSPR